MRTSVAARTTWAQLRQHNRPPVQDKPSFGTAARYTWIAPDPAIRPLQLPRCKVDLAD